MSISISVLSIQAWETYVVCQFITGQHRDAQGKLPDTNTLILMAFYIPITLMG